MMLKQGFAVVGVLANNYDGAKCQTRRVVGEDANNGKNQPYINPHQP